MSDLPEENKYAKCGCGNKLGLINLVLNVVILAILLIHFVGGRHHHHWGGGGWCHHGMGGPAAFEGHYGGLPPGPGPGPEGFRPGFGHGPGGYEHGPAMTPDAVLDHVTRMLSLTDDQKAKMRPIVTDTLAALEKNRQEKKEAAEKIMDAAKAKALPLLTPEQKKIVDSLPQHKP